MLLTEHCLLVLIISLESSNSIKSSVRDDSALFYRTPDIQPSTSQPF